MKEIFDKFISNCSKSIEIGFIRYSLYNLSVLIIPTILAIIPWIGFILPFINGDVSMFVDSSFKFILPFILGQSGSIMKIVFSVVMFVVSILLTVYTENCAYKAYAHTIETGEKLGYKEYFRGGVSGYLSFFGRSILNLVLPMIGIAVLTTMIYMIPFFGYVIGDALLVLGTIYLSYRFYSKLLNVDYDDFKVYVNNFTGLIIVSTVLSFFGLSSIEFIVNSFIVPICMIIILSKSKFSK